MLSCFGGSWQKPEGAAVRRRPSSVDLPDDIIEQILIKLPAKYLGRCRCVCRRWKALTSTLEFAERHHNHSNSVTSIILRDRYSNSYKQISRWNKNRLFARKERISTRHCKSELRLGWHGYELVFLHCFNGILVFEEEAKDGSSLRLHHFILYNPTTKEKLRIVTDASYIFGIYFNQDRSDYSLLVAALGSNTPQQLLGQSSTCAQYNVVDLRLRSKVSSPPTEAQTKTRSYTKLVRVVSGGGPNNAHSYLPKHLKFATPVIADGGVLHWVVENRYGGGGASLGPCCEEAIMAFDPRREEIRVMPHPGAGDQWCKEDPGHQRMHLVQMGDHSTLCLCEYSLFDTFIDIWVSSKTTVDDGGNTRAWRRGQRVNVGHFPLNYQTKFIKPVALVHGDLLLAWEDRGLIAVNLGRKGWAKTSTIWWSAAVAYAHNPSLVPLSNSGSDIWVFPHLFNPLLR